MSKHVARTGVVADGLSYRSAYLRTALVLNKRHDMLRQGTQHHCCCTGRISSVQGSLAGTRTFWAGPNKQQKRCKTSSAATEMTPEVKTSFEARWLGRNGFPGKSPPGVSTRAVNCAGNPVGPCLAIMAPPGPQYVAATWASWLSGGIAVPLCLTHPSGWDKSFFPHSGALFYRADYCVKDTIRPLLVPMSGALVSGKSSTSGHAGNCSMSWRMPKCQQC